MPEIVVPPEVAAYHRKVAENLPHDEILHNIHDIKETLDIWRDYPPAHPYVAKLLSEFDAYTTERNNRGLAPA